MDRREILRNKGILKGTFDCEEITIISNEVETILVEGITIEKEANKRVWISGKLKYTITIKNETHTEILNGEFIDKIDIHKVKLVPHSVKVNGEPHAYEFEHDGTLKIKGLTIGHKRLVITFEVEKKHERKENK